MKVTVMTLFPAFRSLTSIRKLDTELAVVSGIREICINIIRDKYTIRF